MCLGTNPVYGPRGKRLALVNGMRRYERVEKENVNGMHRYERRDQSKRTVNGVRVFNMSRKSELEEGERDRRRREEHIALLQVTMQGSGGEGGLRNGTYRYSRKSARGAGNGGAGGAGNGGVRIEHMYTENSQARFSTWHNEEKLHIGAGTYARGSKFRSREGVLVQVV